MRRALPLLLLALLSRGEATDSSDAFSRFLAACGKAWAAPPASASTTCTIVTYAGEQADTESTFGGKLNHLPGEDYLRMQEAQYVEKAVRVRDGWAFHRIVTEQKGEGKADRDEMDAWRRGKALVRTKGKGYETGSDEVLLEPSEVLKGLVEKEKGALAFRMKDPEAGWKAEGEALTWTCEDPERLDKFTRSSSIRHWLKEMRMCPPKTGSAKGVLTVTLDKEGRIAKAVRQVVISLPCRPSKPGGGSGGAREFSETTEAAWGYEALKEPEVPAEVRKRLGWEKP